MSRNHHNFNLSGGLFDRFGRVLIVIGLSAFCSGVSCSAPAERKPAPSREEGARVLAPSRSGRSDAPPARSGGADGAARSFGAWSIVLESFQGPQATQVAHSRVAEIGRLAGRSDVSVRTTPRGAAIVAGAWIDPADPDAQEALRRVRSVQVGADLPFAQAFLAPPLQAGDPGEAPELNLLAARDIFGARAEYTLQIAVYESPDRAEAKRAAEQAALRLRRDGELAFYYHGPSRSMVTVGIFSERDLQGPARAFGPAILAVQERYPLNLLNGQYPILERAPGEAQQRKQPSTLVRIPG